MSIITISRGSLSGGQALAEQVAQRLGYRCISREVLVEAAAKSGVPEPKLSQYLEKMPGVWERLTTSRRLYLIFIQAAMCEFAQQGRMVYHGLAGQQLLKGIGHVLKVRLIAPLEHRIKTAIEREGLSRTAAVRHIQQVDEERLRRMRYLFEVDWREPALYDVVFNLEQMSLETVADVVVHMAQHAEYRPTPASEKALADLALSCRVKAAVAAHPATLGIEVEVWADGGTVRLTGVMEFPELVSEVVEVVEHVLGVEAVLTDFRIRPVTTAAEI
jgi:cytidylate kinase